MEVTGVTAMQPLMSPGHLAACREPWVMTKVCFARRLRTCSAPFQSWPQSSSWLLNANSQSPNSPNLATNTPVRHGRVRG